MSEKLKSGIYIIEGSEDPRFYVGQSRCIEKRWKQHLTQLRNGRSKCKALQASWSSLGEPCFTFRVVARMPVSFLAAAEQLLLKHYLPLGALFNKIHGSVVYGDAVSEAHREAVCISHRTPEYRAKMSALASVLQNRPGARDRMSIALKKTLAQPEAKEKHQHAMQLAQCDPETNAKRSASLKRALASPEVRRQRSERMKAWWKNPENRELSSKALIKAWAKRKAA